MDIWPLFVPQYSFSGDPASKSSPISWKEGKNLLVNPTSSETNGSKSKDIEGFRTFFGWYMDNTDPSADDIAEVRNVLYNNNEMCSCVIEYQRSNSSNKLIFTSKLVLN